MADATKGTQKSMEILSVHINDLQTSMYDAQIGSVEEKALFDSGAMLSCFSKQFYDKVRQHASNRVIDTDAGPPIMINSASNNELVNMGCCRTCLKLEMKIFEYYFQIIKNLKHDLIIGLNFKRTFK